MLVHVLEAVHYLHNEAKILRNDITLNNILMPSYENHDCSENLEQGRIQNLAKVGAMMNSCSKRACEKVSTMPTN